MENTITVSKAAAMLGVTVTTVQRWERQGTLVPTARTLTNRRVSTVEHMRAFQGIRARGHMPSQVMAYSRVSSPVQKPDLQHQRVALEQWCTARGFAHVEVIPEVGGGLNFRRKKCVALMQAIEAQAVQTLVMAHQDRFVRWGFVWCETLCCTHGCTVLVLNHETFSPAQEMVHDLLTIVPCFRSRLSGLHHDRQAFHAALKEPDA